MLDVLQKIFSYGCLGLLVEVFFTGAVSLYRRNWRATSQTYLWMLPIYGIGGVTLEAVQHALTAADDARVVDLIEQHGLRIIVGGQV